MDETTTRMGRGDETTGAMSEVVTALRRLSSTVEAFILDDMRDELAVAVKTWVAAGKDRADLLVIARPGPLESCSLAAFVAALDDASPLRAALASTGDSAVLSPVYDELELLGWIDAHGCAASTGRPN